MNDEKRYGKLGLMVGLELHQQLNTSRKLYCHCPTVIRDDQPHGGFERRLRPTQSEMGAVDPAALFEFQRNKRFYYEYYNDTTCLVEADEEPPHNMDEESIDICLTMANFLGSYPVNEVHPMRKIVIDGSNTTGFQRTAIIATGGKIDVGTKTIGIQTICLEEDAARKISDDTKNNMRIYRLDRLGIPLIEIATAPDIRTPLEAQEVALVLGRLLRSTGKVKRGLGTIRQDVNVSIRGGGIIEIKGLQQLDMLSKTVELEALRQERLLKIKEILIKRGITPEKIEDKIEDISHILVNSKSKLIRKALKNDESIFGVKLLGFAGLVKTELQPNRRLGTEFSDYAKFWGGIGGIFHTDELPKYGISKSEVSQIRDFMKAKEQDAIIIVAALKMNCIDALKAVVKRAREALLGVPAETRMPLPTGASKYGRPRPGAERMYPETDARPVKISSARLKRIDEDMPETFEKKETRFIEEYALSKELSSQIVQSLRLDLFEKIINEYNLSPTLVAVTLENTIVSLHRNGVPTDNLNDSHFNMLFDAIMKNEISPEAIPTILTHFAKNPNSGLEKALTDTGLDKLEHNAVEEVIKQIVAERVDFINKQGEGAIGGLMGIAMKQLRGKVDGKKVKELLQNEIRRELSK